MATHLRYFLNDEAGMETVEWAVLTALVIGGVLLVIAGLGTNVAHQFAWLQTATQ